jgi:bifunctional enzyme CysN/CysC
MSYHSNLIADDILAYLKEHENKELLRFLTCGNVDDGKSTLIGRLLHDSKMIFEDQLAAIENDSKKSGTQGEKIDLALLVDGLAAEREQGITIDVAYRYFSTKKRKFIIADTPGHEQYTRNMATGASNCDLAIILIDARHGVQTQTRRHSYIASLLGIKHVVIAINKMDLMDFSEARFEEIKADYLEFSKDLTLTDMQFIPMSALDGDNVVDRSERAPWYDGKTLMEVLETVKIDSDITVENFRLPVQWVNRPDLNFRGFSGTIASGEVNVGDTVVALPSGKSSKVKSLVTYDGNLDTAFVGQAITLTLEDEIDVSRGDMLVHAESQPLVGNRFDAKLVWMTEQALEPGKQYNIKMGANQATGNVSKLHHRIDVNTLEHTDVPVLALNEIGECEITLNKSVAFDAYDNIRGTGSFIIIDRLTNVTVGAGMISGLANNENDNVAVSSDERENRFAQTAATLNISSAELAIALERRLFDAGHLVVNVGEASDDAVAALAAAGLIAITSNQGTALEGDSVDQLFNQLTALNILK